MSEVSRQPTVDGLADRVIAQGRRARQRRTVIAGLCALISVSLVGLGAAAVIRGNGAAPTEVDPTSGQTLPVAQLPVDVLIGQVVPAGTYAILLAGGGTLALDQIVARSGGDGSAEDVRAYAASRVNEGWLVQTITFSEHTDEYYEGTERLWLVLDSDHSVLIVTGHAIIVSPPTPERPGIQVTWVADGTLTVGRYIGLNVNAYPEHPGMDDLSSTPTPQSPPPDPVRLDAADVVGSAITLRGPENVTGRDTWSSWFPDRGNYVPTAYPNISVLGVTLDRRRIIAIYDDDTPQRCLGELDPDGFTPVRTLCPSPITDFDRVFPSPDGRWWAVSGPNGTLLYPADGIWDEASPTHTFPIYNWRGTWSQGSFVIGGQYQVSIIDDVNRAPRLLAVPLPSGTYGSAIEDLRNGQN